MWAHFIAWSVLLSNTPRATPTSRQLGFLTKEQKKPCRSFVSLCLTNFILYHFPKGQFRHLEANFDHRERFKLFDYSTNDDDPLYLAFDKTRPAESCNKPIMQSSPFSLLSTPCARLRHSSLSLPWSSAVVDRPGLGFVCDAFKNSSLPENAFITKRPAYSSSFNFRFFTSSQRNFFF